MDNHHNIWRKEMVYLMMHSTHFIYSYMALDLEIKKLKYKFDFFF